MVEPVGAGVLRWRPAIRITAVALPFVSCALLSTVRDQVTAAATGDRVAGVLAALSGAVWFDFFLTAPYLRFTINDSDDVETTVLLVVISLAVSEIAQGDVPPGAVVELVAQGITDVLDADTTRYVPGPIHDGRMCVLDHDGVLTRNGRACDVDRAGLPTNEYVVAPVRRSAETVGHFQVTATSHVAYPSREQRRVAVLLADQVAAAAPGDAP